MVGLAMVDDACTHCGACCEDFGGDGVSTGLPLLPEEYRAYAALALTRGVSFLAMGRRVATDLASGRAIVSHYVMLSQPCVFHVDGRCGIYDDRSLACRSFPYYLAADGSLSVSTKCPDCDRFKERVSHDSFGPAKETAVRTEERRAGLLRCLAQGLVRLGADPDAPTVDIDMYLSERSSFVALSGGSLGAC